MVKPRIEVLVNPSVDEIDAAIERVEKRARSRLLCSDVAVRAMKALDADALTYYFAEHGGGVPNGYGYRAETSAIVVVDASFRRKGIHRIVVVGRGPAPSGPRGNVGPSVRAPLGAPWGNESGRFERLQQWAEALAFGIEGGQ